MQAPKAYRKKPVKIYALQWTGDNAPLIKRFCPQVEFKADEGGTILIIPTLEGDHIAAIGDFIIQGIKGEFYPCKPDIFKATYEEVTTQKEEPK